MIAASSLNRVVEAMAPLYAAMTMGYAAVRWWHALTPDQCTGINRFVSVFAIPLLTFHLLSSNDPYAMNPRFLAADSIQKLLLLTILFLWSRLRPCRATGGSSSSSSLPWIITLFSLATLPNTVVMGIPLLRGMYGPQTDALMVQIVVLQAAVWYNLVLFLYEYMAARGAAIEGCQANGWVPTSLPDSEKEAAFVATDCSVDEGERKTRPPPPPPSVWVILTTAGRKLCRIPNTHASLLGLMWSLIAFGFGIKMPKIIDDSVTIISGSAIGLSMFSIGTFMAQQKRFISCGYSVAALAMVAKFLVGPAIMIASSLAVGLQGLLLRVAVIQSALPLAGLSFVYAKEYNVHPEIMSTGVILGIFSSVPITIIYHMILGLWK